MVKSRPTQSKNRILPLKCSFLFNITKKTKTAAKLNHFIFLQTVLKNPNGNPDVFQLSVVSYIVSLLLLGFNSLMQWFPNFSVARTTKNILVVLVAQNIDLYRDWRTT